MRFDATVYREAGIQAAIDAFADFGSFDWSNEAVDGYFEVQVESADDVDQRDLEGEFGNFAFARSYDGRQN